MSVSSPKYRPVLTAAQILHILTLAKTESPDISDMSISLISSLAPFQAKIENAGIQAAYTTSPRVSLLDSIGGASSESIPVDRPLLKEDYWEACYNKFLATPIACSLEEIAGAQEHKYLHQLMTPEELAKFEERFL